MSSMSICTAKNRYHRCARYLTISQRGKVLDVGGGEGRNALYLAEQGFEVTVVDLSSVGLNRLQNRATDKDLTIRTEVGDVSVNGLSEPYDGVIFSFVLLHLMTADAERVLRDAAAHTTPGGVHMIATFLNEGGLYERSGKSGRFYPSVAELLAIYQGWETVELVTFETTCQARDKDGNQLKNQVVHMMVQKPMG